MLLHLSKINIMEKELANWIYYEDGKAYYCSACIQERIAKINVNKEFAESINYEIGDQCGFYQDIADEDYLVECISCGKALLSNIDDV